MSPSKGHHHLQVGKLAELGVLQSMWQLWTTINNNGRNHLHVGKLIELGVRVLREVELVVVRVEVPV